MPPTSGRPCWACSFLWLCLDWSRDPHCTCCVLALLCPQSFAGLVTRTSLSTSAPLTFLGSSSSLGRSFADRVTSGMSLEAVLLEVNLSP